MNSQIGVEMVKDGEQTFAGVSAQHYDEFYKDFFTLESVNPTADGLAELVDGGRALEFGIGTGRVAIPLSQRGVEVVGLDNSEGMVAQLRQKPEAEGIDVTIGDMTSDSVPGEFDLVYLIGNTIVQLGTQDNQVECFRNAGRHLKPGGYFAIECVFPGSLGVTSENNFLLNEFETFINLEEHNPVSQEVDCHQYILEDEGVTYQVLSFRCPSPAEMDLMARMAGMSVIGCWESWDKTPFAGNSDYFVSVWQKDR